MKFILLFSFAFFCSQLNAQWIQLFNGKNLDGWQHIGPGNFIIENGLLKTQGGLGLLWYTLKPFENSVIRIEYKTEKFQSNSGVFIRIPQPPSDPWVAVNTGYEVQIHDDDDEFHVTGVLYSFTKALANAAISGDWNVMEITLDSNRTIVKINNILITDFIEGVSVPAKVQPWEPNRGARPVLGYIGLQNHGDNDIVCFKSISVKPLKK